MTPLLGSLVGRRRESIQRIVSGCRELGFGAPATHLGKLLSESFGARIGRSLATPASCDPTAPAPPVCFRGAWPLLTIVIWSSKTDELVASALRALEPLSWIFAADQVAFHVAGGGVGAPPTH